MATGPQKAPRSESTSMPGELHTLNPADVLPTQSPATASPLHSSNVPAVDASSASAAEFYNEVPLHAPVLKGYRVTGRLGEGGMGVVWKAVQLSTHREVALKVMGAAGLGSSRARMRFEREVELSARLDHPGIAKGFDGGLDEGLCFYAMELVQGVALDQFVREKKLSRRDILALMQQVCRAVQHAHQKGIIHRDLKPSNVMIAADGAPKVLDFGLAKAMEGDQAISLDGEVAGTPAYMSPEQAAGKLNALDTRSDVYTLGVILFHLLTGKFPHDTSGTYLEVMKRIAEQEPKKLRDIEPKPDAELQALLNKALAHEPERRYGSAGELADDIGRYLNHEPLIARPPTLSYLLNKRIRKYRLPLSIAAAVLILLIGTATWSYVRVTRERNAVVAANIEKEKQRQEAENQKQRALENEAKAETQRERAEEREEAARRENYFGNIQLADFTLKDGEPLRAIELLNGCPPELRGWEWHYLRRIARGVVYPVRTANVIDDLCFSPRTDILALANGNAIDIWNFNEQPPQAMDTIHLDGIVRRMVFAPDGRTLAAALDNRSIRLLNAYAGKEIGRADVNLDLSAIAVVAEAATATSPLSKLVGLTRANEAVLIDVRTGRLEFSYDAEGDKVLALAVSDDGKWVAGGCESRKIRIWNTRQREPYKIHPAMDTHLGQPTGLAFRPGGKSFVYATKFDVLRLRDTETGALLWSQRIPGHANALVTSSDGARLLVAHNSGGAMFDLVSGGKLIQHLQIRSRSASTRPSISADGRLAATWPCPHPRCKGLVIGTRKTG